MKFVLKMIVQKKLKMESVIPFAIILFATMMVVIAVREQSHSKNARLRVIVRTSFAIINAIQLALFTFLWKWI